MARDACTTACRHSDSSEASHVGQSIMRRRRSQLHFRDHSHIKVSFVAVWTEQGVAFLEMKLPEGVRCCLFDGSMVESVYFSPRETLRGSKEPKSPEMTEGGLGNLRFLS